MRKVFADSSYWIALIHPDDMFHAIAELLSEQEAKSQLITTDVVFLEVLNFFCSLGDYWRENASAAVEEFLSTPSITIIPQTPELFQQGIQLYKSRLDKSSSLTDCISMVVMKKEQVEDVLSSDRHFEQEGFSLLMKQ